MSGLKNILVTRELTDEQVSYARHLGLEPLIEPAIKVELVTNRNRIAGKLDQYPLADWAFTSRNGVEALHQMRKAGESITVPERLYAVGDKTAEALREQGMNANVPERQDATGLARLISADSRKPGRKIIHWCGNRSRPELKMELNRVGTELVPLEVYHTSLRTVELPDNPGEAVLFFSPSAVEAFRKSGGFNRALPALFAIGNTTGELLGLESGKNVHIPSKPSTEMLLKLVADILDSRQTAEAG